MLASFAGDAGVLLMILALATMGVVLVAGQKLSVLWSAFADTCVELYTAIVERIDDASARRALRKEEEERQALIEQREAAKTRRSHTQPVAAAQEEIAFPDPIHEVWGADDANADEPEMLGLYEGVPLTERGDFYAGVLPDRIYIYRRPLLSMCRTVFELADEVRVTVLHEIAHHFGIDDEDLDDWGWG